MCGRVLHVIHVLLSLHRDKLPELAASVVLRSHHEVVLIVFGDKDLRIGSRLDAIDEVGREWAASSFLRMNRHRSGKTDDGTHGIMEGMVHGV